MKKMGHSSWLIITLYNILLIPINNSSASSSHELKEELRFIHQEIGLLRDESQQQNMEITLLKEKICNTKDSDDQIIVTASPVDENYRNKRPARLLPPHILYSRDREQETEQQKQINRRRYEEPANCSDLSILGYTLNGFYQVKSNESTKSNSTNDDIKLETVYCAFKQPEGIFNPSLVEKRIISRRETSKLIFHATRNTDLTARFFNVTITFDKVLPNSGNSFNATKGTFTVPKSGVYLFIFRGLINYPQPKFQDNLEKHVWIYINRNGENVGRELLFTKNSTVKSELDKLVKVNRGDTITAASTFYQIGAIFSRNFTSLTDAYFLGE